MSLQLDSKRIKSLRISGKIISELWFRGCLLYVVKKAPEIKLSAKAITVNNSDGTTSRVIQLKMQYLDFEHGYRYIEESVLGGGNQYNSTHAFLLIPASTLGTKILMYNTGGATRIFVTSWNDDKSAVYNYKPKYVTTKYAFRAVIGYNDGKADYFVYSNVIHGSWNTLQ